MCIWLCSPAPELGRRQKAFLASLTPSSLGVPEHTCSPWWRSGLSEPSRHLVNHFPSHHCHQGLDQMDLIFEDRHKIFIDYDQVSQFARLNTSHLGLLPDFLGTPQRRHPQRLLPSY